MLQYSSCVSLFKDKLDHFMNKQQNNGTDLTLPLFRA